jgi:CDP-diacylglycerol--glycerol-3-phosphate 3-phosphatidyltransferase
LTDFLRRLFRGVLEKIAGFLISMGIKPNAVTITGLLGNLFAAYLIAAGRLQLGGLCALIIGPVDAVDGALARLSGGESRFGAFLDSVVDRYSELALFLGLLIHAAQTENDTLLLWTFIAASGSVLVSYTRARAESLGEEIKVGILTRVERYLVFVPALLANRPLIGMVIIGVLANVTAVQRIWHARARMKD